MSMLPVPGRSESEKGVGEPYEQDSSEPYYPDIQRPRRRYATRTKILAYAVVAGTVLAAVFSFVNTLFLLASARDAVFFGDRLPGSGFFWPTFLHFFIAYAPWLIVAAAIAAAAEHMIRRASQSSTQNNRALIDALRESSTRNTTTRRTDGPDMVDPLLKNLNLEIDPRDRNREP